MHCFKRLWVQSFALLAVSMSAAVAQTSPLQIVVDGRDAATNSALTEDGMTSLAQSFANVVMYSCGALAIFLTALGLFELYRAAEGEALMGGRQANKASAFWKIGIAGAVSIPAIIAGIFPHVVLGPL